MTTRSNCSLPAPRPRRAVIAALLMVGTVLTGCGITGGKTLYMLGFGRRRTVEAKFHLSDGPVMILVDDPDGVVDWPIALRLLQDDLAQALLRSKSTKKIVPTRTVQALRQTEPDFEKRGIREVGRMAEADQVLWVGVDDFFVSEEAHDVHDAAYFVASVKVINAREEHDRLRVRLWPDGPEGYRVMARVSASEAVKAKTKDAISKLLTDRLSETIAKLFHDYRPGDFEREG